jgi:hypothetical protein
MASLNRYDAEPKASSLPDSTTAHRPASPKGKVNKADGKRAGANRGSRKWVTLVVDLILLLVIVGLVVGGVYAYRSIRELYAPTWETREVVYGVEMTGIDLDLVKYGQDGRPTMTGHPLWSSDRTDADFLGTVTDVRTVLVSGEEGENTLNLYLTVEATAYYREGKGYRMGATMLLAGMKETFMAQGLVAEGLVISMHEKSDETDTEAGTVFADPDMNQGVIDPDAQG